VDVEHIQEQSTQKDWRTKTAHAQASGYSSRAQTGMETTVARINKAALGRREKRDCTGSHTKKASFDVQLTRRLSRDMPHRPFLNLIGRRFNRGIVIGYVGVRNRSCTWKLRCNCSNEYTAIRGRLLDGSVKSCGCLRRERMILRNAAAGALLRAVDAAQTKA
jgi:hypothetical protein